MAHRTTNDIALSQAAANRIRQSAESEGRPSAILRLAVEGGGCAGFRYRMELIDAAAADDIVIAGDGARVAIDPVSLPLLAGARIEERNDALGTGLVVVNPSARSGCGCGVSFAP